MTGNSNGGFTDHIEEARAHILSKQGVGTFDVALFEENVWWTDEAVQNLVGQRPMIRDEATGRKYPGRITKAWKRDGMICATIEPDNSEDDEG